LALPLKRDSEVSDFFDYLFLRGHIRCLVDPTATPDLALIISTYMELWLCQHSNNRKANEIKLHFTG